MNNVWEVIHHVNRAGGDVAVASNRSDDPAEWERAHYEALRNMRASQHEAFRWQGISDEMAAKVAELRQAEYEAEHARLESKHHRAI